MLYRLIEQYDKSRLADVKKSLPAAPKRHTGRAGVIIKGFDDLLVRFAGCCNPVPGDTITGFISRGRGISIHRSDCPNLRNVEKERLIEAQWTENKEQKYSAGLQILAHDSPGLIANIGGVVSEMKLNIASINARVDKTKKAIINVTVALNNVLELDMLINKLKSNPRIIDVFRTTL